MAKTQLNSGNISGIQRNDHDITTVGEATITKVIAGSNITLTQTGADAGTGDVTISAAGGTSGTPTGTKTSALTAAAAVAAANEFAINEAGVSKKVTAAQIKTFVGAGGSAVPAGSAGQIQFNSAGAFGADADLTWDAAANDLIIGGVDPGLTMNGITAEPPAPPAGNLTQYVKLVAGRMVPKVKGPSGLDYPLQASFWGNNITMWNPTTATAGAWLGTIGAGAGTYSTALPTATNVYTAIKRGRWANVVTTLNQVLGQRNTEAMFMRGSLPNQGGFFFFARCGFDTWTNGSRFFAGMHSATTVVSADPSALANTVGFCVDALDNGAISFLTRDATAATKAATGFTIVNNKGYDLYIFCPSNSSQYGWRIVDFNAGTEASGTATLNLPVNTTTLTAGVLASNGALATATATNLGINRIYVETDY